ncbi:hypothetical protein CMV_006074 [Castanea mollissima]|uniref:Reverse transcriptase zinc-binding domain-containing protein n=1 Tax=Castanea mollissima TaxID=60419 RepID=A0A8J4RBC2_9ROSI|nr:hypothetical protein CMV_006074 [Castanea mollissima]
MVSAMVAGLVRKWSSKRCDLGKYCSADRRRSRDPDKLPTSPNWVAVKLGSQTFEKAICWGVGNGERIKVSTDCWIKGQSLRELVQGPLTRSESDMVVVDFMYSGCRGWIWEDISFVLPQDIRDKIRAIPCQQVGNEEDKIIWKFSKDGNFSTKSAYDLANLAQEQLPSFLGQWIWKLDVLPKIVNFLWLILYNSMPVRDVLASRGIDCNRRCPLCKDLPKSINHLLRECVFAHDF